MSYDRIGVIGAMDSELAALIAALAQPARETVQGLVFHTGRLGAREVVLVRCGIGKVSAARCTQVLIDRFAPDAALSALLARTAGNAIGAQRVHRGLIATGDQFISGAAAKAAIRRAFPAAMAAEMEGGAVAQAASMSGVPFAVVRAISDLADGTAAASFEQFEQHAADASAAAVLQALALLD